MPQILIGTSGWAYPSWKPGFYPEKLAQTKFLTYYASQLNTVEVNLTFRQLLKDTTAQKWISQTPEHFRFTIKAHQVITHIKRLKGTDDFVPRFLATIEPLAAVGKLGPVLFQLPPNLKMDVGLLKNFLDVLPRTVPAAFEFRHASWFCDETWDALKSKNVALCIAETETMNTPEVTTAAFVYYRFRKPTYSGDEKQSMIDRIKQHLAESRDVFAYFKHEETPEGVLYALELRREIAGEKK